MAVISKAIYTVVLAAIVIFSLFFTSLPSQKPAMIVTDKTQWQLEFVPSIVQNRIITIYVSSGISIKIKKQEHASCSVSNCRIEKNDSAIADSDALLLLPLSKAPLNRRKDQLWIMSLMESPENTPDLKRWNSLINYTASYRTDGDLPQPYGYVRRSSRAIIFDNYDLAGKTGQILWVASNCFTSNGRHQLVAELRRYIDVAVYGTCGKGRISGQQMEHLMRSVYKFYLAFENSNCRDYITEKFYNSNNIVPIVFGEERLAYERYAPPGSFIHVQDFPNVRSLAEYLRYLDKNETAYKEYFRWKSTHYLADSMFYCRLCKLLQQPQPRVYANIQDWWHRPNDCNKVNKYRSNL